MAGGNNSAKKIIVGQARDFSKKLKNGSCGCVETQGKAIALLIDMVIPAYMAEFVTVNQCKKMHIESKKPKTTRIKIGPVEIEGTVTTTLLTSLTPLFCVSGVIFMVGKMQGWW